MVTAAGILLALAVLAMTVGLIRSETAQDLSTLAATGASSGIRRTITAATAASLALIGGVMGTVGAYLVLIAWHRRDLSVLSPVPIVTLLALVVGLPAIAWVVGWLLGGREPGIARHVDASNSAPGWTRTCNLRIRRPLLYPLSYGGLAPG